jgi:hypothetical protein
MPVGRYKTYTNKIKQFEDITFFSFALRHTRVTVKKFMGCDLRQTYFSYNIVIYQANCLKF